MLNDIQELRGCHINKSICHSIHCCILVFLSSWQCDFPFGEKFLQGLDVSARFNRFRITHTLHCMDSSNRPGGVASHDQESNSLRQSCEERLCWLLCEMRDMLSGLFWTIRQICNKECFSHDGHKRLRILHICASSLLFSNENGCWVFHHAWSRTRDDVLR